jgi:hypothetical protein
MSWVPGARCLPHRRRVRRTAAQSNTQPRTPGSSSWQVPTGMNTGRMIGQPPTTEQVDPLMLWRVVAG